MATIFVNCYGTPCFPELYDVLMNTQKEYTTLLETKKYSPRVEAALERLKDRRPMEAILHGAVKVLVESLKDAFEEREEQLAVLKELRFLHPNSQDSFLMFSGVCKQICISNYFVNFNDIPSDPATNLARVSHNQADYPLLFAGKAELSTAWVEYCVIPPTNLGPGDSVVDWWRAQPDSALKEEALFMTQVPPSTGAVERFFSKAKLQDDRLGLPLTICKPCKSGGSPYVGRYTAHFHGE